jgi:hypothetical protein
VRTSARMEEGDLFDVSVTPDGILLRPLKLIDATQAWYWAEDWQAGERDVERDRLAGRVTTVTSADAMIESLRARTRQQA